MRPRRSAVQITFVGDSVVRGAARRAPSRARRGLHRLPAALLAIVAACGGEAAPTDPTPPPPPPNVYLKEIVIPRLPSPLYHFDYDATGRVSRASYASGLTMYDVRYDDGRISEMRNNTIANHDRLVYAYDDAGRVIEVDYLEQSGLAYTRLHYAYDGRRLIRVDRELRSTGGFVVEKTISLSYDADGNLREVAEHRLPIAGVQDESAVVDRYEDYDDAINVDGFSLLHDDFFDHLVLLPDVQLQHGNPRRQTRSGDGDTFTVDYVYTYDDRNRPLAKTGDVTMLSGPQSGQHFETKSLFSYY